LVGDLLRPRADPESAGTVRPLIPRSFNCRNYRNSATPAGGAGVAAVRRAAADFQACRARKCTGSGKDGMFSATGWEPGADSLPQSLPGYWVEAKPVHFRARHAKGKTNSRNYRIPAGGAGVAVRSMPLGKPPPPGGGGVRLPRRNLRVLAETSLPAVRTSHPPPGGGGSPKTRTERFQLPQLRNTRRGCGSCGS
jgi:hypothetical protein